MILPAVQAPPDHDRSTAHLALQESPKMSVLMNKVATKVSHKWKNLGLQLEIEYDQLETISNKNQDSSLHLADVFQQWKNNRSPPYTWTIIIDVLRSDIMQEVQLAYELEQWVMSTYAEPTTTIV